MNLIRTTCVAASPCPGVRNPREIGERFSGVLADESRLRADTVKAIYLPRNISELAGAFREIRAEGMTGVISGGRTGITGGAVPVGTDAVVSLEKMKRILGFGREGDRYCVSLEAGVTLEEMENILAAGLDDAPETGLWFPVDPTERGAQLGGMAATNASGPRTLRHGSVRDWVKGVTFVLPTGELIRVRRGEVRAEDGVFQIIDPGGSRRDILLPSAALPSVKCTTGYHMQPGMDIVDLLVGSEGTLGAFAELEVRLVERPEKIIGIIIWIPDEGSALDLVDKVRNDSELSLEALEYFDRDSFRLASEKRGEEGAGSPITNIPYGECAVYLEIAGSEATIGQGVERLEKWFLALGLATEKTWVADNERDRARQKLLRHAVPEAVNNWIAKKKSTCADIHKVGTDFAVPDRALREMFSLYRRGLREAGLQSVVFGHIGNNHVHVNVLPGNVEEMQTAESLYLRWAKEAVRLGGAVSGEHGIGRLKKELLEIQYPPQVLEAMRQIRRTFDPHGILAPGVMI